MELAILLREDALWLHQTNPPTVNDFKEIDERSVHFISYAEQHHGDAELLAPVKEDDQDPEEVIDVHLEVVGCISFDSKYCRLQEFAVRDDVLHMEIGNKLIESAKEEATSSHFGLGKLKVNAFGMQAEIYEKCGFYNVGESYSNMGRECTRMRMSVVPKSPKSG